MMRHFGRLVFSSLCLVIGITAASYAETRYVSDQLVVSLRAEPRDNAETIKYLRTDSALEVLGVNGSYIQVRSKDGDIGYIKDQYLTSEIPKPIIINRIEKERDRLQTQYRDLEEKLKKATTKGDELQQEIYTELQTMKQQNEQLQKNLAQAKAELNTVNKSYRELENNAKNVVAITNERNRLKADNEKLQQSIVAIEAERDSLMKTGVIKWFFAGAGVLFIGWVMGKMSRSRRRPSLL